MKMMGSFRPNAGQYSRKRTKLGLKLLGLFAVIVFFVSMGWAAEKRPDEEVLKYELEGVRLTHTIAEAINILERRGFKLQDDGTDHNDKIMWYFTKAPVAMDISLFHDTRQIHRIARNEKPEQGSKIDIAKEVARIEASWGPKSDKVCVTKERNGQAFFGQCAVSDPTKKRVAYYAQLLFNGVNESLGKFVNK